MATNMMLPGKKGVAGGGIYFAGTPQDTNHKAEHKGFMIKARVYIGAPDEILQVPHPGDFGLSGEELKRRGLARGKPYKSVQVNRRGGKEIVIYSWDQASIISVYPTGKR